ncbi:MAG: hypothetical protein PHV37_02655 [Candidatus Gastranaerophilales bacterium]|nr:hypothetical protein [Candidatus Gastranaerophilales bacterium]
MNERELNTLTGVIADPEKNVYDLSDRKNREEIQRIIRIFDITQSQEIKHRLLSIKNLATFRLVLSNN